jgi:hypothetical protein
MGIYKVKKAFGHYEAGATIQLSSADAEKYKDFLEPVKTDNKKASNGSVK